MSRSLARGAIKRFGRTLGSLTPARARELRPAEPGGRGLAALDRGTCLLLVTHRRDGSAVPTPLWFVRDGERALVRTRPIRRRWRAPAATGTCSPPCDHRGRPLGAALRVEVRLLDAPGDAAERARTDALITDRYGMRGGVGARWGATRSSRPRTSS